MLRRQSKPSHPCAMRRKAKPQQDWLLHQICHGSSLALAPPPQRHKSPELQARLKKLQEELDNKRYNEMVSDITCAERKADEMRGSLLPSVRLQLSFGAHVLVTMFTFWAAAFYGCKWFARWDDLWVSCCTHAAGRPGECAGRGPGLCGCVGVGGGVWTLLGEEQGRGGEIASAPCSQKPREAAAGC